VRLKRIARDLFARAEESPTIVKLVIRFFFSPPTEDLPLDRDALAAARLERLVRVFQEGIASGELPPADPVRMALIYAGIVDTHIMSKAYAEEADPLTDALADALVDTLFDGFRSPSSRSLPEQQIFPFPNSPPLRIDGDEHA
jgi:AcrR family transcriptional regulator